MYSNTCDGPSTIWSSSCCIQAFPSGLNTCRGLPMSSSPFKLYKHHIFMIFFEVMQEFHWEKLAITVGKCRHFMQFANLILTVPIV